MSKRFLHLGILLIVLSHCALSTGCRPASDPELISTLFLQQAEKAFEDRSPRALRKLVSEQYFDEQNRDSKEIVAIGASYIMRSRSIHLFTDLESALFYGDQVHAKVVAAFGASQIESRSLLPQINADLYWFEIVLTKESGDWKLMQAVWRPAMLEDVLND